MADRASRADPRRDHDSPAKATPAFRARRVKLSELHDGFRLVEPALGVEFELTRLRRDRYGDLVGELAVSCGILGAKVIDGTLSIGTFNVSNPRGRHERAKQLAERARTN